MNAEVLVARDPLPGVFDCLFLEVVSKTEVAEHLEEGVMESGVAYLFEIVVLAAGANALLRCDSPFVSPVLETLEDPFELNHSGVGEQQSRVVRWNQR